VTAWLVRLLVVFSVRVLIWFPRARSTFDFTGNLTSMISLLSYEIDHAACFGQWMMVKG
jgi:hypothetical protein